MEKDEAKMNLLDAACLIQSVLDEHTFLLKVEEFHSLTVIIEELAKVQEALRG